MLSLFIALPRCVSDWHNKNFGPFSPSIIKVNWTTWNQISNLHFAFAHSKFCSQLCLLLSTQIRWSSKQSLQDTFLVSGQPLATFLTTTCVALSVSIGRGIFCGEEVKETLAYWKIAGPDTNQSRDNIERRSIICHAGAWPVPLPKRSVNISAVTWSKRSNHRTF